MEYSESDYAAIKRLGIEYHSKSVEVNNALEQMPALIFTSCTFKRYRTSDGGVPSVDELVFRYTKLPKDSKERSSAINNIVELIENTTRRVSIVNDWEEDPVTFEHRVLQFRSTVVKISLDRITCGAIDISAISHPLSLYLSVQMLRPKWQ